MAERVVCLDMSNLLFRSFHASNPNGTDAIALTHHKNIMMLNKYFKQLRPERIVAVFDRPDSWRKLWTLHMENRPSPLIYKGNRRQGMTEREQAIYAQFVHSVSEFETLLRDHTRINTLACDGLEADDLIAGYVQRHPDDDITVVSADQDFLQLLDNPNTKLLNPADGSYRDLAEWDNNKALFMFEKCCRGDKGDNVMRIFPRVFKTKVRQYFTDELARVNAFAEKWQFMGHTIVPGEVFKENKLLMDLTAQPAAVREMIETTIADERDREKRYHFNSFLRFCGKHELNRIADDAEQYIGLFATHP